MDWMDCPVVERVPGKLSGTPVIRHSRVRPEDLVVNSSEGEDWLAEAYDLPRDTIREVLRFYASNRAALAPVA